MTALSETPRILVIDDNPSIHQDFNRIFRPDGAASAELDAAEAALFGQSPAPRQVIPFELDTALQGQEGLAKVQKALVDGRPYAMAFIDVRMPPGWDGVETIKQIWEKYPDLQVVICTAYSDYSWEDIAHNLGASDSLLILKKPFDNVEVLQLAHALTRKWILNQQARLKLEDLDRMVSQRTVELKSANEKLEFEVQVRRAAEDALRISEERFSKAFHSSPLPMLMFTVDDYRCLDVNARFLEMLEYTSYELLSHKLDDLPILADTRYWKVIRETLDEKRALRNFDCSLHTKSGKQRTTLLWAEFIEVAGVSCVLLLADDITERRDLERQLYQAQKLDAVGQLATGIAHDFNNIMTIIQGHVELLLSAQNLDPRIAKALQQVVAASTRASSLTRQLLTFTSKQPVQPKVLDVNERIESMKAVLARVVGEQITVRCDFAPSLPSIFADLGNFEQIVVNLTLNARDAMAKGGTLAITTQALEVDEATAKRHRDSRPGQYICISVMDNGCGISANILPRIFEPFFTTKQLGKGTGLGLSTVYGIVRQLKGWIEVQSTEGKGSTFRVFLPAHQATGDTQSTAQPSATDQGQRSGRILLVEDEEALRELNAELLTDAGYQVLTAPDGVQALRVWKENNANIDMLFTDILMPNGVTGGDLARRLRADRANLKVLLTSGYSDELIGKNSLLSEGLRFLPKPFSRQALLSAIEECLEQA